MDRLFAELDKQLGLDTDRGNGLHPSRIFVACGVLAMLLGLWLGRGNQAGTNMKYIELKKESSKGVQTRAGSGDQKKTQRRDFQISACSFFKVDEVGRQEPHGTAI